MKERFHIFGSQIGQQMRVSIYDTAMAKLTEFETNALDFERLAVAFDPQRVSIQVTHVDPKEPS